MVELSPLDIMPSSLRFNILSSSKVMVHSEQQTTEVNSFFLPLQDQISKISSQLKDQINGLSRTQAAAEERSFSSLNDFKLQVIDLLTLLQRNQSIQTPMSKDKNIVLKSTDSNNINYQSKEYRNEKAVKFELNETFLSPNSKANSFINVTSNSFDRTNSEINSPDLLYSNERNLSMSNIIDASPNSNYNSSAVFNELKLLNTKVDLLLIKNNTNQSNDKNEKRLSDSLANAANEELLKLRRTFAVQRAEIESLNQSIDDLSQQLVEKNNSVIKLNKRVKELDYLLAISKPSDRNSTFRNPINNDRTTHSRTNTARSLLEFETEEMVKFTRKKDPDQEALEHGIMLSNQLKKTGTTMYTV
jgi:hypothetical protein